MFNADTAAERPLLACFQKNKWEKYTLDYKKVLAEVIVFLNYIYIWIFGSRTEETAKILLLIKQKGS